MDNKMESIVENKGISIIGYVYNKYICHTRIEIDLETTTVWLPLHREA